MATNIPAPVHALSVDVEDYFHVSAFRPYIRMSDWDRHPLRIEDNVRRLLDIFADRGWQKYGHRARVRRHWQ